MSAADKFAYDMSLLTDVPESPFLRKEIIYIQDQNNSSLYSGGQIQYDFSQISNSFKWADWSSPQTVLEIPFTIVVENTNQTDLADMSAVINSFFAGLKNGTHQIINSINVTVNNTSVVQLSNYLNHYISYKLMTEMSELELKKWGASTFFAPDSATSVHYSAAAGPDGQGITNNRTATTGTDLSGKGFKSTSNEGFASRLRTPLDLSTGVTDDFYGDFLATANCNTNAISYFTTPDAHTAVCYILATVRLADLADFFKELPLVKGTYIQMTVNTNGSVQTISYAKDTTALSTTTPQITGLTNPIMVSSAAADQPNHWMNTSFGAGETGTFKVSCGVGTVAGINNPLLGGRTRLSIPLFSLNPLYEQRYLSLKTKDVYYTDIYTYMYYNIAAGESFNFLATNGISQPEEVTCVPFLNKASNGTLTTVPVYQSPFASEPGTPSPIVLTNLNVAISGSNIFQQMFDYDYQAFLTELASTGLNGGESVITSGLISQQDFTYLYRYYTANVGRRLPNDDVARSVQIMGKNNSTKAIDLLVVISYRRKVTIDLSTGALLPTV